MRTPDIQEKILFLESARRGRADERAGATQDVLPQIPDQHGSLQQLNMRIVIYCTLMDFCVLKGHGSLRPASEFGHLRCSKWLIC